MNSSSSTTTTAEGAEHSAGLALPFGISVGVVSLVIIAFYLCNYKRLQLQVQPPLAAVDDTQHSDDEDEDEDDVEHGPAAIIDFPRTRFSELPVKGDANCCAICLGEYKDDDDFVRQLPHCHHMFHVHCITRWLGLHGTCPLCRSTSAGMAPPHPFNFFIPFSR